MGTIDWTMIGVVVAVVLAIAGAFSSLLWVIRRGDLGRIAVLEEAFKALRGHSAQLTKIEERKLAYDKMESFLEDMHADIEKLKADISKDKELSAVASKSIVYLEENLRRMTDSLEKLREEMKDVVVTINGFGRDYVTRKEYNDLVQCMYSTQNPPGVKK